MPSACGTVADDEQSKYQLLVQQIGTTMRQLRGGHHHRQITRLNYLTRTSKDLKL